MAEDNSDPNTDQVETQQSPRRGPTAAERISAVEGIVNRMTDDDRRKFIG